MSVSNGARALVVLVVEDEVILRIQAAICFHEAGFTVIESGSGEEAIALIAGKPIDIVFTDINLGGGATGWDVADNCRTHHANVPVLYTSGSPIDSGRSVPGSQFLAKPYRPHDILTAVSALLRH
jgi:CheY-like chemotaxis protein